MFDEYLLNTTMKTEIGAVYEFTPKVKVFAKKGVPKHLEHYHYFIATKLTESGLEGHMLTSTLKHYDYNKSLREEDFEQHFEDGEECIVKYKNSRFLTIPLIKLSIDEVLSASYVVNKVGRLTKCGLEFVIQNKAQDQAMTWYDYLKKYCNYTS
ncbi:hypothetical protein [Hymenobacter glacialis]|uniref:hypothetical protein n=1 Tax=Hymenobacter glacialis TaxID=1908236 RepID=UPI000F7B3733|nr:hypothetical protein [Hymenobacter glacialis]